MSRGFLAGAGWGTVVAGLGLVVASQVTELDTDAGKAVPAAVDVTAVETGVKTGPIAVVPEQPTDSVATPVTVLPDAPQDAMPLREKAQNGAKTAPDVPPTVPEGDIAPNQVTAPGTVTSEQMGADAMADSASTDPVGSPEAKTSIDASVAPELGAAPNVPSGTDPATNQSAMAVSDAPTPSSVDAAPETAALPETVLANPETDPVAGADQQAAPTGDTLPERVEPEVDVVVVDPPVVRPAPGFSGVDGVKTGRLPSIGAAPDATAEANTESTTEISTEASVGPDADSPPIERYARKFENTAQKPLFAILLRDTGGPEIDRETLASISFPVSFIIDPALPDAAIAAQIYRAAGQEVLMLGTGIPAGATASDVAVSLEAMGSILPEAVGIVDQETGGFQGNRTLATQVLAVVGDQGRGVISWDKGLNAASQVAQRTGIRNAVIFRSMDGGDEKSAVIRRYLDRAAFKAAQDGRVVVEGKTRPETVTALLEWAVEGRASTVAIAPATAVMTAQ